MCGISGFVSLSPQPASVITRMNNLMRHRGPDDEGYLLFENFASPPLVCSGPDTAEGAYRSTVAYAPARSIQSCSGMPVRLALGHRRLSIVDLSPCGHQPMCTPDRRYWIVYNGEIYNYPELRQELEGQGYCFASHTDTEVILAAYTHWGEECQQRFNGMWAFAIYDTQAQSLFLSRDRFGVKPLYYWIDETGALAFASEIKAFCGQSSWQAIGNPDRLYDFLAWGIQDHTDETLFRGVYQLAPGHCCTLGFNAREQRTPIPTAGSRISAERWYTLDATPFSGELEQAAAGVRQLLSDSVRLRLRADVPVGSCLSGGLDSSSLVCIANRMLRSQSQQVQQKTFSACADVARFDERQHMEAVVAQTGVDAHYVYPSKEDLFHEIEALIWHQDEPFGSTSIFAQWSVFKLAAANNVRVMLDGQGADELLAGYHNFFGSRLAGLGRRFQLIKLAREWHAIRELHGYGHYELLQLAISNLFPRLVRPVAALQGRTSGRLDWLDLKILGARKSDPIANLGARGHSVRDVSIAQLRSGNIQMLLHWEDRNSMAHSIESRVPFLDYRLVEYVLGLPDDFKIQNGATKKVLRDAMREILPDQIRLRMDKLGFTTPEEVWIRETHTAAFRKALVEAIEVANGVLTPNALRVFDQIVEGKRPYNWFLWRVISFGYWVQRFQVQLGLHNDPCPRIATEPDRAESFVTG